MKNVSCLLLACVMLSALSAWTEDEPAKAKEKSAVVLNDDNDKLSYAVGLQVGKSLQSAAIDIKMEPFLKAVEDVMADREPALSEEEMMAVMNAFRQKAMEKMEAEQQAEAGENLTKGEAFLKENAAKEGVKTLESGLQYRVIEEGDGPSPAASDQVKVHYRGTLIDGTQFDSSYDRNEPAVFGVTQVINGWTEALQLMKKGAKWQLFIPPNLAYGPSGRPGIPPNAVLLFDVELLEINP